VFISLSMSVSLSVSVLSMSFSASVSVLPMSFSASVSVVSASVSVSGISARVRYVHGSAPISWHYKDLKHPLFFLQKILKCWAQLEAKVSNKYHDVVPIKFKNNAQHHNTKPMPIIRASFRQLQVVLENSFNVECLNYK
jgi:hypothetical protein